MKNRETIADELYYKLSKFSDLQMLDAEGSPTDEVDAAVIFQINYGSGKFDEKIITFNMYDPEVMEMLYSRSLTDGMDSKERKKWYAFVDSMRDFATTRMMAWKVEDFTKPRFDKNDFDFIRHNSNYEHKDAQMESKMYGSRRSSYAEQANARLIVRHSKPIDEEKQGARARNIESIYIENAVGERFLVPRNHLPTARAMARHISNEGVINDDIAESIIEMHDEMKALRSFTRKARSTDNMMEGAEKVVEAAKCRYRKVKKTLESIQKQKGYQSFAETFERQEIDEDEDTYESLRDTLTKQIYNEEFDDALPYLNRAIREAEEEWEKAAQDEMRSRSQSVLAMDVLPLRGSAEDFTPTAEKIDALISQIKSTEFEDPNQKKEAHQRFKYTVLSMFKDEVLSQLAPGKLDDSMINAIMSLDLEYQNDPHMGAPVVPSKEDSGAGMHLFMLFRNGKVEYVDKVTAEDVDVFEAWANKIVESGGISDELVRAADDMLQYAYEIGNTHPDHDFFLHTSELLDDDNFDELQAHIMNADTDTREKALEIMMDSGQEVAAIAANWMEQAAEEASRPDEDEDLADMDDDGDTLDVDYDDEVEESSDDLGEISQLAGLKEAPKDDDDDDDDDDDMADLKGGEDGLGIDGDNRHDRVSYDYPDLDGGYDEYDDLDESSNDTYTGTYVTEGGIELEVTYKYYRGMSQTRMEPAEPESVEILSVTRNGKEVENLRPAREEAIEEWALEDCRDQQQDYADGYGDYKRDMARDRDFNEADEVDDISKLAGLEKDKDKFWDDLKKDPNRVRTEEDEVADIIAKHLGSVRPLTDDDLTGDLGEALYEYFLNSGDMPYGTAKARDGDPDQWIYDRMDSLGFIGESMQEADHSTCPDCGGSGIDRGTETECELCGGTGTPPEPYEDYGDEFGDELGDITRLSGIK